MGLFFNVKGNLSKVTAYLKICLRLFGNELIGLGDIVELSCQLVSVCLNIVAGFTVIPDGCDAGVFTQQLRLSVLIDICHGLTVFIDDGHRKRLAVRRNDKACDLLGIQALYLRHFTALMVVDMSLGRSGEQCIAVIKRQHCAIHADGVDLYYPVLIRAVKARAAPHQRNAAVTSEVCVHAARDIGVKHCIIIKNIGILILRAFKIQYAVFAFRVWIDCGIDYDERNSGCYHDDGCRSDQNALGASLHILYVPIRDTPSY